jgi:hypothetical protein
MMGCSGFLIVVAAFCLHTGLFSNRHYLAFGLVVIPSVLIMAAAVCEAMGKDGWYRKLAENIWQNLFENQLIGESFMLADFASRSVSWARICRW